MSMTVSTSMQDMRSTRRAAKECGCAPTLNSWTAYIARLAFKGLTGGLCDPYEEGEIEESTYADVKECIEHVFEKHKESVEISPGIFLDQKEARGYLIWCMSEGVITSHCTE